MSPEPREYVAAEIVQNRTHEILHIIVQTASRGYSTLHAGLLVLAESEPAHVQRPTGSLFLIPAGKSNIQQKEHFEGLAVFLEHGVGDDDVQRVFQRNAHLHHVPALFPRGGG